MVNVSRAKRLETRLFPRNPEPNKREEFPQQGSIEFSDNSVYGFLVVINIIWKDEKSQKSLLELVTGPQWSATKATSDSLLASNPMSLGTGRARDRCLTSFLSLIEVCNTRCRLRWASFDDDDVEVNVNVDDEFEVEIDENEIERDK